MTVDEQNFIQKFMGQFMGILTAFLLGQSVFNISEF